MFNLESSKLLVEKTWNTNKCSIFLLEKLYLSCQTLATRIIYSLTTLMYIYVMSNNLDAIDFCLVRWDHLPPFLVFIWTLCCRLAVVYWALTKVLLHIYIYIYIYIYISPFLLLGSKDWFWCLNLYPLHLVLPNKWTDA